MTHTMKEISPFMHTALFNHSQFKTFDEFAQSGMLKYCLTNNLSEEILKKSLCVKPTIDAIVQGGETLQPCKELYSGGRSPDEFEDKQIQELAVPIVYRGVKPSNPAMNGTQEDVVRMSLISMEVPIIVEPVRITVPQNTRYNSRKPDTLFWSIFIAQYGVREFTEIGSKYMNREIEEKMRVMEFIKKNRPRMKSMKITAATGEEMMGDLLTNQSTSMLVLPALALFYETRIWIVSEETNTYLEYLPTSYNRDFEIVPGTEINIDYSTMIIYRATYNGRVSYTTETNEEPSNLIEKIQQTMIRIENVEHPFKGISTYKLVDLEEIANKLKVQIPAGEKWKKNDWYVAISRHTQLGWIEPTRGRKPKDH